MTDPRPPSLTPPPAGYADWLAELKTRTYSAQQRAALLVNRERVLLYWQIGRDILERQASEGWGAKVIDRLSHDLRTAFPRMQGFSPRSLKHMRAFARAWPDAVFVQEVLAQLPWYHHLTLLDRLRTDDARRNWHPTLFDMRGLHANLMYMRPLPKVGLRRQLSNCLLDNCLGATLICCWSIPIVASGTSNH